MVRDIQHLAADVAKLVVVPVIIVVTMAYYATQVAYVASEPLPRLQPQGHPSDSIVSVRSHLDDIY